MPPNWLAVYKMGNDIYMENYLNFNIDLNKLPKMYDELPLWSAPFGLKLLDYIHYKPDITAVDLGFGTGFPLIEIAMRLGNSSIVYGIDIWSDAFEKVNEKIKYYGIDNIKLFEANVESIPLGNNSVDLITSNNCINNVQNLNKAILECSRVIKKNGQIIMTMNLEKSMFEFYNIMEQVLLELKLFKEIKSMYQHIEQKRPSVEKVLNPLKNDFTIKDIEYDQFNYKFSNGTAMLNHYFIKLAFMESWKKLLPENKIKDIFKRIETELNEQARKFG